MIIGIIGSGGREHAICQSISNSSKTNKIFCFPGNAGTKNIAQNVNINLEDFENLKNFILDKKIDLVVVGPEKPLVEGLVDYLEKFKIKVFGPNKISAQLEGSKIFTKKLCKKFNIPTADFGVFKDKKSFICAQPMSVNLIGEREWVSMYDFVEIVRIPELLDYYRSQGMNFWKYIYCKNFALRNFFNFFTKILFNGNIAGKQYVNFYKHFFRNLIYPYAWLSIIFFAIRSINKVFKFRSDENKSN